MKPQGRGSIVKIAVDFAVDRGPRALAYCASKGVGQMTERWPLISARRHSREAVCPVTRDTAHAGSALADR